MNKKKPAYIFLTDIAGYVLLSLCFLIYFFLGPSASHAFNDGATVYVTVAKGDCLINICREYLENPGRWKKIARMNKLKNPDLIHPGQTILIPAGMLKGIPDEGTVVFVRGAADYQPLQSVSRTPLLLQMQVSEGSTVRTGDGGSVEIVFRNGDSFLLKSKTSVGISSARQKGSFYMHKLFLNTGKTITKIKGATGKEDRFEIQTPSAICAARGTVFRTSVDAGETTRNEVIQGIVSVQAMDQTVIIEEGHGVIVKKGESPSEPRTLLPPPVINNVKPVYKKIPLLLGFEKVAGAVLYRIVLSKDRDGRDTIIERFVKPEEILNVPEISDGSYFIHLWSIDESGLEGSDSEPLEIKIRTSPAVPFVQVPVSGTEYREKSAKCQWLNVKDASAYHVQISSDVGFSKIIQENKDISQPGLSTDPLQYGTYYFRVCSVAGDGFESEWSDPINFSIAPPPPAPPLDKPAIEKKEVHIRWKDLGEGFSYHFQMSGSPEFKGIISEINTAKPEVSIKKPAKAGIYYVRTSSIDAKGCEGSFSAPQSFTIEKGLLAEFLGLAGSLGLLFFLLH